MSDTPRTDKQVFVTVEGAMRLEVKVVSAELSRELERESARRLAIIVELLAVEDMPIPDSAEEYDAWIRRLDTQWTAARAEVEAAQPEGASESSEQQPRKDAK